MKQQKTIFIFLAIIGVALVFSSSAVAQTSSVIDDLYVEHSFGESINFSAQLALDIDYEAIDLIFKVRSTGQSTVVPASLGEDGVIHADFEIRPQDYIPAFSTIDYWFLIKIDDGTQRQSDTESFVYEDNRFQWQRLQSDNPYEVYWVEGNLGLGQSIQDSLYQSIDNYSKFLDLPQPDSLRVYIYSNASALQSALEITNARWIAGHANPTENTILASIPPSFDQNLEIKRQIPHELTHIRLYLYLEDDYANLPAWYSEGLASLSELYSIPEYWEILQAAWRTDELIPLTELCTNIPSEADRAALAYAQADSFVRFLYDEYGKVGLQDLLDAYKQGHTCENGVQTTFNRELATLEKDWYQNTFNSTILPQSLSSALTWVILLLLLFATPIGLILVNSRRKSK